LAYPGDYIPRGRPQKRRKNPKVYTVTEIADILGFTRNAVLYWIREHQLPARYDEDKRRFEITPANLRIFLEEYYESI